MSMSNIHTSDPIALRYLMTEPVFTVGHESPADIADKPEAPAVDFVFYGKNKRRFLFLTNDGQHQWMSTAGLDAFTKTLTALKCSIDDVALLNLATLATLPKKEELVSFFNPTVIVLLGVSPEPLGLGALLTAVNDCSGISVFQTGTFDEMLVDAEMKRRFWTTIKTLLV